MEDWKYEAGSEISTGLNQNRTILVLFEKNIEILSEWYELSFNVEFDIWVCICMVGFSTLNL